VKTPNLTIQHSVVAPPSGAEIKLNAGAQLQTFPFNNIKTISGLKTP